MLPYTRESERQVSLLEKRKLSPKSKLELKAGTASPRFTTSEHVNHNRKIYLSANERQPEEASGAAWRSSDKRQTSS